MTALHAAGGGLPLAVHLPHVLEQIGSLAGFAAIAGLAVLSALYFSQARDVKRLREWAGRAPERAAEAAQEGQASTAAAVPGRVVPVPQPTPQAVKAPAPGAAASAAAGGAAGPAAGAATAEVQEAAAPGANGQKPEGEQKAEEQKAVETAEEQEADGAQDGDAAAKDGDDAGDGSAPAPGKPGMPAPASAAAAAGAGAAPAGQAAVAGEAATGAAPAATPGAPPRPATGPGVPPARPPTSVLPPRTGAAPPVRRIGGTAAGNPAFGPPPADTPVRKRNPVYIALAVAGVLVLGAGAAIGVPKLVSGGSSDNSPAKKHAAAKKAAAQRPALVPAKITVSVLNGTTVPGLAAQIGDQVQSDGFNLGNTAQVAGILEGTKAQQANSVVMYSPGHAREARFVAKRLHLTGGVEAIDQNSRQLAGDATVVVVAGEDQAH